MGCCGQKREALKQPALPKRQEGPTVTHSLKVYPKENKAGAPPPISQAGMTPLRYIEQSPVQVRGNATGNIYRFSGGSPVQMIDRRDAEALLKTRFFKPA